MTWPQRIVSWFAAALLFLTSFNTGVIADYERNPWLALTCFMLGVGLVLISLRKVKA